MTTLQPKDIQLYTFQNHNIRVYGTHDNPYFVVKDVCDILELSNVTNAMRNIPEKWKRDDFTNCKDVSGREVHMLTVNESGLYKLILRSNKPIAEKFQEWVCEEVLPSIRKSGEYVLKEYKERIEAQQKLLEDQKKMLEEKDQKIRHEQQIANKAKQVLEKTQQKFTHRHKFPVKSCVYIFENPQNINKNRYKIGKSDNLNERLKPDRTMIPDLKIRFIWYVEKNDLFENMIKTRFAENLESNAHEWIYESLDNIIQAYHEIDIVGQFHGYSEKEIWRYNLEEPPVAKDEVVIVPVPPPVKNKRQSKYDKPIITNYKYVIPAAPPVVDPQIKAKNKLETIASSSLKLICSEPAVSSEPVAVSSPKCSEPAGSSPKCSEPAVSSPKCSKPAVSSPKCSEPKFHNFGDLTAGFLPVYKLRPEYKAMNEKAPVEYRFCNGYHQSYVHVTEFRMSSASLMTICKTCEIMLETAYIKLKAGDLTLKQIREDPNILKLKDGEMICKHCREVFPLSEFQNKDKTKTRRECRKCHNKQARSRGDKFDELVEDEVFLLKSMNEQERLVKLDTFTKRDLQKMVQFLKIGRKYNDNKQDVKRNIINFLK